VALTALAVCAILALHSLTVVGPSNLVVTLAGRALAQGVCRGVQAAHTQLAHVTFGALGHGAATTIILRVISTCFIGVFPSAVEIEAFS
jgi:hypothetical protein